MKNLAHPRMEEPESFGKPRFYGLPPLFPRCSPAQAVYRQNLEKFTHTSLRFTALPNFFGKFKKSREKSARALDNFGHVDLPNKVAQFSTSILESCTIAIKWQLLLQEAFSV